VCLFNRKRLSKWDRRPNGEEKAEASHSDDRIPPKKDKQPAKSKWDKLPDDSKWDQGPSESKWDIRPEDVAEQDHSSVGESQTPTTVTGGCGMVAAAEAAARVNAMLMAKGTLKPAEPLLVNDSVLKSKQAAVSCYMIMMMVHSNGSKPYLPDTLFTSYTRMLYHVSNLFNSKAPFLIICDIVY